MLAALESSIISSTVAVLECASQNDFIAARSAGAAGVGVPVMEGGGRGGGGKGDKLGITPPSTEDGGTAAFRGGGRGGERGKEV